MLPTKPKALFFVGSLKNTLGFYGLWNQNPQNRLFWLFHAISARLLWVGRQKNDEQATDPYKPGTPSTANRAKKCSEEYEVAVGLQFFGILGRVLSGARKGPFVGLKPAEPPTKELETSLRIKDARIFDELRAQTAGGL